MTFKSRTAVRLSDGRELIYFNEDASTHRGEYADTRRLPPPPPTSQLRYDPLTDEWVAVAAIGTLHLDMLFLGVHGMSERAGYTTPNLMEADVNRALVEAAERLVVLADHTKWGTVGISSIVALDRADVLITDDGLDEQARALLQETVPELVVVSGQ